MILQKGVHTAARKGSAIAIWEHLRRMNARVSKWQLGKLHRIQRGRALLRQYRMSKVSLSES